MRFGQSKVCQKKEQRQKGYMDKGEVTNEVKNIHISLEAHLNPTNKGPHLGDPRCTLYQCTRGPCPFGD